MTVRPFQVVIVDDDDLALGTLQRLVTRWGYDVVPFARFEEARAFIEKRSPDALVVDVRLGSYNGLQLVHLARQTSPQITVVAISGFDDAVLRGEAERAGAAYLVKPLALDDLKRLLPTPVRAEGDSPDV
jgi:DNA-binding response OmpR family regulator